MNQVKPYEAKGSKKEQVRKMFNNISQKYDIANNILSFGIHHLWKKKCTQLLQKHQPKIILDLATGTGDIAIYLSKLKPEKIIAADYADEMLLMAKEKVNKKKLSNLIIVQKEDGENLSFADKSFDAVTISFGIRNFENYQKGLKEMNRVLKNNGALLILEFTMPQNIVLRWLYKFYFKWILPLIAWLIAGDRKAYTYLPESVEAFPQYEVFCNIIKNAGFVECKHYPLTGGIACIYVAKK